MAAPPSPVPLLAGVSPERLADVCGENPALACRWVLNWTDNQFLANTSGNIVGPIITIIVIWIVAILANKIIRYLIKRMGRRMENVSESEGAAKMRAYTPRMLMETGSVSIRSAARAKTVTAVLRSISSFVVYTLAFVYSLNAAGVQLGPLVAGAGIAGVALGFGAQTMVKDFLGGMFMLVEDQFGVGDVIDLSDSVDGKDGVIGTVEEVTLRITSIRDVNGTVWHIPNGDIRRVGNMSQEWARALLDIPVPYGTDLVRARQIIETIAHDVARSPDYISEVLGEPSVWGVQELGPDAVLFRLVIKTRPGQQWGISRALRAELHDAFVRAGIERPFAQHDVYLHTDDAVPGVPARPSDRDPTRSTGEGERIESLADLGHPPAEPGDGIDNPPEG